MGRLVHDAGLVQIDGFFFIQRMLQAKIASEDLPAMANRVAVSSFEIPGARIAIRVPQVTTPIAYMGIGGIRAQLLARSREYFNIAFDTMPLSILVKIMHILILSSMSISANPRGLLLKRDFIRDGVIENSIFGSIAILSPLSACRAYDCQIGVHPLEIVRNYAGFKIRNFSQRNFIDNLGRPAGGLFNGPSPWFIIASSSTRMIEGDKLITLYTFSYPFTVLILYRKKTQSCQLYLQQSRFAILS